MKHSRNLVLISSYLTSLKSDKVITVKAKKNFFEKYDQSTGVHMMPKNLHLVAQVLQNSNVNFEPCQRSQMVVVFG